MFSYSEHSWEKYKKYIKTDVFIKKIHKRILIKKNQKN